MNNKMKKGFTLVELVVVIAIIGVLAAILIPTMMHYVKKARLKSANVTAKLVFTSANTSATACVAEGESPSAFFIKSEINDFRNTATSNSYQHKVCLAIADALKDNGDGNGYCALKMESDGSVGFAQWAYEGTTNTQIIGQYPNPPLTIDESLSITFGTEFVPTT